MDKRDTTSSTIPPPCPRLPAIRGTLCPLTALPGVAYYEGLGLKGLHSPDLLIAVLLPAYRHLHLEQSHLHAPHWLTSRRITASTGSERNRQVKQEMGMKRHASEDEEELSESEGGFSEYDDELDSENELKLGNDDQQNEVHKEDEMEELEKEYSNLRSQEEDLLKNLKRNKDDDIQKGQAVKNQKEPWRSSFSSADGTIDQAYTDLVASTKLTLDSCVKLQEALIENSAAVNQVSKNDNKGNSNESSNTLNCSRPENDDDWLQVQTLNSRIAPFRDSSIDKWQRKTQMTTGAAAFKSKLRAFNQSISQQVATNMRDPSRMIKRMQLRRSLTSVIGNVPDLEEDSSADGDPELLDDSEFYQQLLKEFLESFHPDSTENVLILQKTRTKKKKSVDRRASKSRKIRKEDLFCRYNVHDKIVNFMAPEPLNLPPMANKLFENLFGLRTMKST
ncbi:bfr2 protein [Nymphaea thermarum]|nr:bfr2 protein [Nymphaea thermarum]